MPALKRPDTYDYIGMSLVALLVVMWVFHFILPPPPPLPDEPGAPGSINLPGPIGAPPAIGRPPSGPISRPGP